MTRGAGPCWGRWYLIKVCVGTTGTGRVWPEGRSQVPRQECTGSSNAQAKMMWTGPQQPPAWGPKASRRNTGDYLDGSQT